MSVSVSGAEVNKGLPTLHRYFRLRQRMLGLDELHYYDLYPPLVSLDKNFDFETSKAITLEAMEAMGDEWVERQTAAMNQRWMHVYPQRGKRSGAYMQPAAYDVHPYDYGQLCNQGGFEVHRDATKPEIKKAVEKLFDTKVESVRVARVHGKVKRQGRFVGQRPDWKNAWVVLKKDAKMIEFFEQA